jgi:putative hemolysin
MNEMLLFKPVAIAMLILANAYFVAAEFALVSIRDTRVEQMLAARVPGARAVRRLQRDLDDLLPTVQLGVTLCSLALGWLGEPFVADLLAGWMSGLPYAHVYAHIAAVTIGFALITYFDVVIGELVPKSLALRRAEALAITIAPPMLLFMTVGRPVVRMLSRSAALILRCFDINKTERAAAIHSAEELKLLATTARKLGLLPELQELLVHRTVELGGVPVREIMTPRQKIFALPSNMLLEDASARVIGHSHSRVPVFDEMLGPEHIIGAVYARDLARLFYLRASLASVAKMELRLRQIMHEVLVVPETKSALDLLRDFQKNRRHIAIVVDEYGSTVGLVTTEDAIEQLVGELEDEFDVPSHPVRVIPGGAVMMDGSMALRDLETQMQWSLPRDGGVETLAGFVLAQLGHIPEPGESVLFENRRLTVLEMEARRIAVIRVEDVKPEDVPPAASDAGAFD